MREKGAGTVAVVVLVVVILACVGFIVYHVAGSRSSAGPDDASVVEQRDYKCAACGWSKSMADLEADEMEKGPGAKEGEEFRKCPKCGKFAVGH